MQLAIHNADPSINAIGPTPLAQQRRTQIKTSKSAGVHIYKEKIEDAAYACMRVGCHLQL
jgi:hypothetical protein